MLYQVASFAVAPLVPFVGGPETAGYVVVFYGLPILLGGVILVLFGLSVGWPAT